MGQLRHRHVLAAPFVVIVVVALIGGVVNSLDARGRVTDELTGEPIPGTNLLHGNRSVTTNEHGEYVFPDLPRTSKMDVRPPSGYLLMTVLTTVGDIQLHPLALTLYAHDETKTREEGPIKAPEARDIANTKIMGTGNDSGQITISPHPGTEEGGRHTRILLCAEGFEAKEIDIEGVLMVVGMKSGGTGCPPLPTPTPDPNATPTPAPSPAESPSPAPSPSPSPTPAP